MKSFRIRSLLNFFKYGARLRPARDWYVLLVLFSVALGVSIAWNLWLFEQITKGQTIGGPPPAPAPQIQLDTVKALFEQRAAERARYTSEYRFVDPSL